MFDLSLLNQLVAGSIDDAAADYTMLFVDYSANFLNHRASHNFVDWDQREYRIPRRQMTVCEMSEKKNEEKFNLTWDFFNWELGGALDKPNMNVKQLKYWVKENKFSIPSSA